MKIVVNHLTRMKGANICVAGVDLASKQHVRPVRRGNLTRELLTSRGGPVALGAVVELQQVAPSPGPPHVEDHRFTGVVQAMPPTAKVLNAALAHVQRQTIAEIFGDDLQIGRTSAMVEPGNGRASLGVLRVSFNKSQVYLNKYGKLRLRLTVGDDTLDLGVTDLRLYDERGQIRQDQLTAVNGLLTGAEGWLAVGLARAFTSPDNVDHPCYLQVNNIFPQQNPLWGT